MKQTRLDDVAGGINEVHQLEEAANESYDMGTGYIEGICIGMAFPLYMTGHYVWGTVAAIGSVIFGFRKDKYENIAKIKTEALSEAVEKICTNCLADRTKNKGGK